MIKKIILSIGFLSIYQLGYCQIERPNNAIATFETQVTRADSNSYLYHYILTNSKESKQVLETFKISISDPLLNGLQIESPANKKWYIDGLSNNYITGVAANRIISLPPKNGLAPNEKIEFEFESIGLPTIHLFLTKGHVKPLSTEAIDSLFEEGYSSSDIYIDWKDFSYKGFTISPKLWSADLDQYLFLDELEIYLSRSCEEFGWITKKGICNSLEVKLNNVQKHLDNDKPKQAANVLHAFIHEVNAQKDKALNSEAYALLFFNGEYLLKMLEEDQ